MGPSAGVGTRVQFPSQPRTDLVTSVAQHLQNITQVKLFRQELPGELTHFLLASLCFSTIPSAMDGILV
jgi:hypothetical protein